MISSVRLLEATNSAYWDLDRSRMYWHWGMKEAELWRLNRRDWASSRLMMCLSLALDDAAVDEDEDDGVVVEVDGFPR